MNYLPCPICKYEMTQHDVSAVFTCPQCGFQVSFHGVNIAEFVKALLGEPYEVRMKDDH